MTEGPYLHSTAHFVRNAVLGRLDAGGAGVQARAADEAFHKRRDSQAISPTIKEPRPVVVSVESIFAAAEIDHVVAAVAHQLYPRSYVPAERTHGAVYIGESSGAVTESGDAITAKKIDQRHSAN